MMAVQWLKEEIKQREGIQRRSLNIQTKYSHIFRLCIRNKYDLIVLFEQYIVL